MHQSIAALSSLNRLWCLYVILIKLGVWNFQLGSTFALEMALSELSIGLLTLHAICSFPFSLQPVPQAAVPQGATLLPAQHLNSNDLLVKLDQLSSVNSLNGLATFKTAPGAPTLIPFQQTGEVVQSQSATTATPADSTAGGRTASTAISQSGTAHAEASAGVSTTHVPRSPTPPPLTRERSPLRAEASGSKSHSMGKKV